MANLVWTGERWIPSSGIRWPSVFPAPEEDKYVRPEAVPAEQHSYAAGSVLLWPRSCRALTAGSFRIKGSRPTKLSRASNRRSRTFGEGMRFAAEAVGCHGNTGSRGSRETLPLLTGPVAASTSPVHSAAEHRTLRSAPHGSAPPSRTRAMLPRSFAKDSRSRSLKMGADAGLRGAAIALARECRRHAVPIARPFRCARRPDACHRPRSREIIGYYDGERPGAKTSLARLLMHGRTGASAKPCDPSRRQGFEHGPAEAFPSILLPTTRAMSSNLRLRPA